MEILTLEPGLMIWEIISFVGLLIVLWRFAWGPLLGILNDRETKIKESLEVAENTRVRAEELMEEHQKRMEAAKLEAQHIIEEGRKVGEGLKQDIIDEAQKQADTMIAKTKQELARERELAMSQLRKDVADMAVGIAAKVIHKSLSKEDHVELIENYLAEAGNGE